MAVLTTALTYDSQTIQNHKQWAQGISNAVLSLGWVNSGDVGSLSYSGNMGTATITNITAAAGVVTVTFSSATNSFSVSQKVLLTGLTTNTGLNNQYIVITTLPSTTTFTFNYSGAITNGADTGTVTILYNWNTLTNTPDQNFSTSGVNNVAFPSGSSFRFRGAWVGVSPTFTNLQTSNNQTTLTFATPHGFDLTRAVGLGVNILSVANASFTWLNTAPPSGTGWPITSVPSTTTLVINTASSPRADIASTPVSAGTATAVYTIYGPDTSNPPTDSVIYQGDLYCVCTNVSGVSAFTGTPGISATTFPGWKRFMFDMFTSNDLLSSTNKLYVKFLYGSVAVNASAVANPALCVYAGTASDGVGNITQNYSWPINSGNTPFSLTGSPSSITGSAQWESNFSGTPGRLGMLLWRGFTSTGAGNTAPTTVISIERSHDNNGNDTDAYWTICASGACFAATTGGSFQVSIFKPGTGGTGIMDYYAATAQTLNCAIKTIMCFNGQSFNNQIPIFPIFPMIGSVGNPLINTISMKNADTNEGALVNATFYGTTHPYLMTTRGGAAAWGYNGNNAAGIRWE